LKSRVAEALVNAAVYVAREEDHHVGAALGRLAFLGESRAAEEREDHRRKQEQREKSFHGSLLGLFFSGMLIL
jgi:hypothetical protein